MYIKRLVTLNKLLGMAKSNNTIKVLHVYVEKERSKRAKNE